MKKVLIQFEYKHWLLKPATLLLLSLWVAILLFVIHNGNKAVQQQVQKQNALHLAVQQNEKAHLIQMDSFLAGKKPIEAIWDDPTNAYMIGEQHAKRYFIKEPLPLAGFSSGQSLLHHSVQTISTSPNSWFTTMKQAEKLNNPHNITMGNMDVSFVLLYLFPLLIIVFNFGVLSAEKEEGRLPLLLIQGVSVKQLFWHKTGFRFIVITLLTILVTLIGYFFFEPTNTKLPLLAFTGYIAALILYSACWHMLCIWISLLKKGSDFNAGVLFTCWIALVTVIPALATVLITAIKPTTSKMQLMDEVRETLTAFDRKNSQILDAYYTDHPELVTKDSSRLLPAYMYRYMIKYKHTLEALQPIMSNYKQQSLDQANAAVYISIFSPAMLWQELADEYSGNSQTQFLQFEKEADATVFEWNAYFTPKSLGNRSLTKSDFTQLSHPVFNNVISINKLYYLMGGMLLWLAIMAILIQVSFKKYNLT